MDSESINKEPKTEPKPEPEPEPELEDIINRINTMLEENKEIVLVLIKTDNTLKSIIDDYVKKIYNMNLLEDIEDDDNNITRDNINNYEKNIIEELNTIYSQLQTIISSKNGGGYYNKYLKYKNKYLKLKH
jgi:hypothetical protein